MGQKIANSPLNSFQVKTVFDVTSHAIQEISTTSLMATRIDEGATYLYLGYALPGTTEASSGWRICRFTIANVSGMMWADGDTNFDNQWDLRESLTYL